MITTTTDRPDHDVRPRGKAQRERWYGTHARPAETLFVVILPNGAIGLRNGAAAVSDRRDVLEAVVDRLVGTTDRSTWKVQAWTFEEGARVHRLANFAAVREMFS